MEKDKYDIDRFVKAHNYSYNTARKELKKGQKESHWMWYIFPQVNGLGYSYYADKYAIKNLKEAEAYFSNETLKAHYMELCEILDALDAKYVDDVFPIPDDLKFRSSLTLFFLVTEEPLLKKLLNKYFDGDMCQHTVKTVKKWRETNV